MPREMKQVPVSAGGTTNNCRRIKKYKKAPTAPKRFKSAFVLFSAEKHKEIRKEMGENGSAGKVCLLFVCVV